MIREFSVKPSPSNNKARFLFIACLATAFLLITLSTIVILYKGVISTLGVVILSLGLIVFTRYIAPVYYYDITFDTDEAPIFVVRQSTGNRHTTLCRIYLADIDKVEGESASQRRAHRRANGVRLFSYLPTIDPEKSYRISAASRYEELEIIIECSDEFADLLRSYATEAKSVRFQE